MELATLTSFEHEVLGCDVSRDDYRVELGSIRLGSAWKTFSGRGVRGSVLSEGG